MKIKEIYETMAYGPAPKVLLRLLNFWKHTTIPFSYLSMTMANSGFKRYFDSSNPATKEKLATLAEADEKVSIKR